MSSIPRDKALDSTLALRTEGYEFIANRCRRYQSDIFQTRLMLRKAICMMGAEAAREFYEPERFTRRGALPPTTLRLLQDLGSAAVLDGEAHRHRKQMFMSLMTPPSMARLADELSGQWRVALDRWTAMERVVLHDEVQGILCRAVCRWAGVPLSEEQTTQRTREFSAMISGAGNVGPQAWRGLLLRNRTERWAQDLIEQIRAGRLDAPDGSAAQVISSHRDLDGELLDARSAAVELINVLRPTVAVAWYITFAALALHEHPHCRGPLRADDDEDLERFVQEVRRLCPFFPFVSGRVRNSFEWRGHHFAKGAWVLLDIYGTNRDPRSWAEPDRFDPERFRSWDGSPFNLIPQGGGDHLANHRCAGEWITIELMKTAVRLLTTEMSYDVPEQDLRFPLSKMPTLPNSRFIIARVRPAS